MRKEKYKRLDLHDRCLIEVYINQGKGYEEIGTLLRRNRSTIQREVTKRSKPLSGYDASYAQSQYEKERQKCRRKKKMEDEEIANHVLYQLKQGWSPEIIAGRLQYEIEQGLQPCSKKISHETIYQYIYDKTQKKEKLWEYLRYGKKRRTQRHSRRSQREIIEGRVFIDKRPVEVHTRGEIGHWETDTVMYGKKRGINTVVERVTRYVLLSRLQGKGAKETEEVLVKRLSDHHVTSITADNGIENKNHQEIAKQLHASFYFCHPYHSWEKGTNENANGILRRYLPKHTNLDTVTNEEIDAIEWELNTRPRKILGFKTPYEQLQYHYQFVALAT